VSVILVFCDQVQLPGSSGKLDLEGGCRLGWLPDITNGVGHVLDHLILVKAEQTV